MTNKVRQRLSILLAVLVVCSLFFPSRLVLAQTGEPQPDGQPGNNVFLPMVAGDNASATDEQAPVDQPVIEEQMAEAGALMASTAVMAAPSPAVALAWSAEVPVLTDAQVAQLEAGLERTNLPGPAFNASRTTAVAGPPGPETQSAATAALEQAESAAVPRPLAPGSVQFFRNISPVTPSGSKSNVLEASVAQGGKYWFYTGNWFAARSGNGAVNRTYVNPYSDMSDFCCDQVTLYDESRDMILWYRQSNANSSGVNYLRLGVSTNGGVSFCNYDISPVNTNGAWTNQWWDYPHLQLGADYLYIASNMFNASNSWTRSVLLRFPLDNLHDCAGFGYNYYADSSWFTFVPVQGADHIMYFASNWPNTAPANSRIIIWKWSEDSASLSWVIKTVAAWTSTGRGAAVCGAAAGNWAARTDHRLLTGARYMIHGNNLQVPGRKVLGWWWNVAQGGGFGRPYIEAAAFYEDTLAQVSGNQGRPLVWNSSICFLYPSVAANKRGDLAMVLNEGTGVNQNPSVDIAIADDYVGVPPGWPITRARNSNARPADNRWGDYNIVRPYFPSNNVWIGGAHHITQTTNCTTCGVPAYFAFGRSRDYYSWARWQGN